MSEKQRRSIENGIWLCRTCAALIDRDTRLFTVGRLQDLKVQAERRRSEEIHRSRARRDRRRLAALAGAATGAAALFLTYHYSRPADRAPHESREEPAHPAGWPRRILPGSQVDRQTRPGTFFQDCSDCPLMVVVPAGRFYMGAAPDDPQAEPNERPRRVVTLARPFAVSVYETTFREWDAGVRAGRLARTSDPMEGVASDRGWGRGLRPVIDVSFNDANAYVQWLNERIGRSLYRIPSEAEWEYAARGGATTRYAFGPQYRSDLVSDGHAGTLPVGTFPANGFGLRDVHGNVWEWTADCWHLNYRGAPSDGTAWIAGGDCSWHSVRGGSWGRDPFEMRLSNRFAGTGRGRRLGFRVVRDLV